jgi:hypothetical protein
MKRIFCLSIAVSVFCLFPSCNGERTDKKDSKKNSSDSAGLELWAEQIESSASLVKPEGWSDEDWHQMAKGVDQEKIFNTVVEAVLNGKAKAYDYISDSEITTDQVKSMLHYIDTLYVENIDHPGEMLVKSEKHDLKSSDISMIRFKEKWHFDKENLKFETKVNSIALFTTSYSETGEVRGNKALFYINLN